MAYRVKEKICLALYSVLHYLMHVLFFLSTNKRLLLLKGQVKFRSIIDPLIIYHENGVRDKKIQVNYNNSNIFWFLNKSLNNHLC